MCWHLLAFVCDYNQHTFEIKMPETPINLQNGLTLIENVVDYECLKVSKKRKSIEKKLLSCEGNLQS